jgi:hypothetical protein
LEKPVSNFGDGDFTERKRQQSQFDTALKIRSRRFGERREVEDLRDRDVRLLAAKLIISE